MIHYSANLSMLWTDRPPLDRFEAAAAAGFTHVEMLFPQVVGGEDVKEALTINGLQMALFDFHAGDWDAGERGIAALPDRVDEFRSHWPSDLELASELGTRTMTVLAGIRPAGVEPAILDEVLIGNLSHLGRLAEAQGVTVTLEAINGHDVSGFHVQTIDRATAVVAAVDLPNVQIQLDAYHVYRENEDPIVHLENHLDRIGHVQIADVPGRHEPGSGSAPIESFLTRLATLGYAGRVGLEYVPSTDTDSSLGWLPRVDRGD